jgi:large conductance mechanosensitive channel
VDLAVGVIIGAAFGKIVDSLVNDVIMPVVGLAIGRVDFANLFLVLKDGAKAAGPYASLAEAKAAGAATLNYGPFINTIVVFLIVAAAVFLLVRAINRLHKKEAPAAPTTRECPYCLMAVPVAARKCAHCTSAL